ncbi:hypothetical protein HHK36_026075 [Tetracentron sinense]|uniref:Uncharacterized protein n=1 Tax=Tetracentron sinense TaxID=13715 RepID=A0A834YK02_TETSI|nr:hypothetical protein HHK36_026075 [Tetracentron sinense]
MLSQVKFTLMLEVHNNFLGAQGMSSAGQQGDMPPSSSVFYYSSKEARGEQIKTRAGGHGTLVVDSNTYGQPCNDVECPLARFIGLLIRDPNLLDINVKDWRKVPNDRKEMLYDHHLCKKSHLQTVSILSSLYL